MRILYSKSVSKFREKHCNFLKIILLSLIFFCFLSESNAGNIKGKVKYEGKPVGKNPLLMGSDPICGAAHSEKVFAESFKVNDNGELAECIVYLKNVTYSSKTPSTAVELDQKGCIYSPHVFGIQTGQELLIKNSDLTLHNIHSMPIINNQINFSMPKVVKTEKIKFDTAEDPFYIKCDVHPWMKTWVLVSDHPYFAVTDINGNYQINDVPIVTYELVFWQEKFKRCEFIEKINVSSKSVTKNFTFSRELFQQCKKRYSKNLSACNKFSAEEFARKRMSLNGLVFSITLSQASSNTWIFTGLVLTSYGNKTMMIKIGCTSNNYTVLDARVL